VKDFVVPIIIALIAGLSGGGMLPLIQVFRGRGRAQVDAVDALSDTAREWVAEFKSEATEARSELRLARIEATALARDLRRIRIAIMAPDATVAQLRAMVETLGAP